MRAARGSARGLPPSLVVLSNLRSVRELIMAVINTNREWVCVLAGDKPVQTQDAQGTRLMNAIHMLFLWRECVPIFIFHLLVINPLPISDP